MDVSTQPLNLKSVPPQERPEAASPPVPCRGGSEHKVAGFAIPDPHEKALLLWLQWNEAYEGFTELMFQAGSDQQAIQAALDASDRLRQQAVQLTREIVNSD